MKTMGWTVAGILLASSLLSLSTVEAQERLSRSEFEARLAAFDFLLENYVSRHPGGAATDFCIVSGRRSWVALEHQIREDDEWDPVGPFLRRLTGRGVGVHPISACSWDGDEAEREQATGAPAVTVALDRVNWTTPSSGTVHMRIQENWRHTYGLRCMVSGREGNWSVFNCVDRPANPPFVGRND